MMELQIQKSIFDIADGYQAILLDAYGVFWGGNGLGILPGAQAAMQQLVSDGKAVGILSNSTQLAAKEIDKLSHAGLKQGIHFHFLLTSGEVARDVFTRQALPFPTPHNAYMLFGERHPKFGSHDALFQDSPYRETDDIAQADFIYISIPHIQGNDQTDIELFRHKVESIRKYALPMVCANPDHYAHEGMPPKPVVRQGCIAALYEQMGGQVFYIGKPAPLAYAKALQLFVEHGIGETSQILMVGDTPETDIRGAHLYGIDAALVISTGIAAERIVRYGLRAVMKNLPLSDIPDYLLKGLG